MIQQEISYNTYSPISIYKDLRGIGSCLLELTHEKKTGKISYVGIDPMATFRSKGHSVEIEIEGICQNLSADPYEALKNFTKERKAFGFISYNAIRLKEKIPDRHEPTDFPDFFFHLYRTLFIFNHDKQTGNCLHEGTQESMDELLEKCRILSQKNTEFVSSGKTPKKLIINSDISEVEYIAKVERAKSYIKAGDIFQVVLSRTLEVELRASPLEIYQALCCTSPSPYQFLFEENDFAIVGASPELLISVQKGKITSMPMAGTRPKEACITELMNCPKENAEHVMLVDLARNDVGVVSQPGTVQVTEYKVVKSLSHVNHIVSSVIGKLAPVYHPLDAFKASFPAGTLSGAPKIRAMEIIDELESSTRDLYGGAIVYIDEKGDLISAIAIRTAYIHGKIAKIRVGAGIVLDSCGEKEFQETEHKAKSMISALELAEGELQ